ncbi:MAG: hypothetical protein Q8S73_11260, partial [Deltaproteobacteria bacterium]|nr:hypothetical protein [Deltaproteobacteria bacterium]
PTPAPTPDVPATPPRPQAPPLGPLQNIPINQILQQGSRLGRERLAQQLERYLEQNPDAPDRDAIRQRITALRAPPPTTPAPPAP